MGATGKTWGCGRQRLCRGRCFPALITKSAGS
nr:MAG TPA: hypothetical protein [Caudoviricetes sp.]